MISVRNLILGVGLLLLTMTAATALGSHFPNTQFPFDEPAVKPMVATASLKRGFLDDALLATAQTEAIKHIKSELDALDLRITALEKGTAHAK